MKNGNAREELEGTVRGVIIISDSADAGVRIKSGNDGIVEGCRLAWSKRC
jgi:hypothetical protein